VEFQGNGTVYEKNSAPSEIILPRCVSLAKAMMSFQGFFCKLWFILRPVVVDDDDKSNSCLLQWVNILYELAIYFHALSRNLYKLFIQTKIRCENADVTKNAKAPS
jgi:hypothetical protein